ncbi:MAG: hypothetical protein ABI281_02865 [Caldimonas sp.]
MHHRPVLRSALALGLASALAGALLLAGCGGGGDSGTSTAPSGETPAPATTLLVPVVGTAVRSATVVLPAGVALTADKLTVVTSVGAATPTATGAVTVTAYDNGAQLAIANNAAGHPMLMGWIDATHTTISAATTAHVLAYFALNGALTLNVVDRTALIEGMPAAPGIGAVELAVRDALARNVDAFATRDAGLTLALSSFAREVFSNSRATRTARAMKDERRLEGVLIEPQQQSGITVLQDPPFAAHITNEFRRRAHAFVARISHSSGGVDVADPLDLTDFDVDPVVGVNGGVTGAVSDIVSAYYGNQPSAYAPTSSSSFALPLVDGSEKTSYRITVVGPGAFAGTSGDLTDRQKLALTEVSLRGFVKDFLVPTVTNALLGAGQIDFTAGQNGAQREFLADIVTNVTSDFIAYAATDPAIADKITKGQWFDAGVDLTTTVANLGTLRTIITSAFERAVVHYNATLHADAVPAQNLLDSFNGLMNAAGGILQVFDSSVYVRDLAYADRADQWRVAVNAARVTLNPPATTIDVGGTVVLTATVVGVDDISGYSFHWSTTTQVGELNEIGGGSRTHQTDYCSSSPKALFVYKDGATDGATDTVSVEAFSGSNCDAARGPKLGTTVSAAVTLHKTNGYSLYGGPGGYCDSAPGGAINNDDSLTVYLNGTQVFFNPGSYCNNSTASIPLPGAQRGDIVRVVVRDERGHHAGLSALFMQHEGRFVQVDPGFNKSTPDGTDNGVQYDHSFAVPF